MKTELSPAVTKYLKKVARRLDLPKDMKKQVCDDLQSSIARQVAAGTTESRVLLELGTPKELAAECNKEMEEYTLGRHPYRFVCLGAAILSVLVLGGKLLAGHVLRNGLPAAAASIGVIGGADGPTSIFITGSAINENDIMWVIMLLLGVFGFYWFSHKHKGKKD